MIYVGSKHKRKETPTKKIKKMAIGGYILIITLHVKGLNRPTKRQRLDEWIQNKMHIYAAIRDPQT